MPYLQLDQARLFYASSVEASHEIALVLIHGSGGSHLNWPTQLRRLPGVDVYALDLPGHGRSAPPGRTSVDEYVDIVLAFVEAKKLDSVVIAGHSMGGAVALTAALRHHPAVSGLLLIGTGARLRVTGTILDSVLTDFEGTVETIMQMAWAANSPQKLVNTGRQLLKGQDPVVVHGDYVACNLFDVMERLGEINVPTLVVSGSADRLTPVKYGNYLAESIPNARLVVIEGGGHMMALEQPTKLAQVCSQFLSELEKKRVHRPPQDAGASY